MDKPPVSLWIQVAAVKLFGFRPLSVLLPQVLEGIASVGLLFHLVRRRFSASAALLAALFFAITPVFVAVNRTNNTDSCLVLGLLLAAWALLKAAEEGKRRLLFLSMALIGLSFNIKMLAAFVVLPTFFLVYYFGAPQGRRRRIADLTMAVLVVAATSLPWMLAYELTPADRRPFIGGSSRNSMLELVVGYNGIGRFVSRVKEPGTSGSGLETGRTARPQVQQAAGMDAAKEGRPRGVLSRLFVQTPTGPLRLADGQLAAQVGWLLPMAFMALAMGAVQNRFRRPLAATHLALLFWFCWVATYIVVYSFAGGIMHFYYLATMAPALAALAGIGLASLWSCYRQGGSLALLLPATLLLTAPVGALYPSERPRLDARHPARTVRRLAGLAPHRPDCRNRHCRRRVVAQPPSGVEQGRSCGGPGLACAGSYGAACRSRGMGIEQCTPAGSGDASLRRLVSPGFPFPGCRRVRPCPVRTEPRCLKAGRLPGGQPKG